MRRWISVLGGVVFLTGFLAGCVSKQSGRGVTRTTQTTMVKTMTPSSSVASATLDEAARMERCQRELDVLKKINSVVYEKRHTEFKRMMSGAGVYSGVRGEVSTYTQEAVDAFYRFRAEKLCADIANDVLSELAKQ
ncbi:hypothetical protein JRK18_003818 [Salmonella enterica]|uniref:hypothetical protein n=1 Tax=Salmonella enterica TaxID=28901 RepID=UPI0005035EA5|nr:hypothetical protein [Salmonella enterica]EAA1210241.1 hypothetical protein [Salmonella enterica subsp. enterica serovar Bareilly]EAB7562370.1 hypothetical protein [Salmonella enterica subsp. enterica serovar Newport]ECB3799850.1 hypothetical protein [Salmonella enterica subsp. enterica serovar Typhimurium]EAB8371252.1 hypothetical protein [Salmonella enterica subsp. enterica serovar Bareilly]EAX6576958.1 hypothetical protein [Salmonella enterica]